MKFDESTISAEKRAEWAQIERDYAQNAPALGAPVVFDDRPLMWFVGAELHVDGYTWADCYNLADASDQNVITEHIKKRLGNVRILFDETLL
jgi:hypothetical protein